MGESMRGLVRSSECAKVSEADIGKSVTLMGWVARRRNLGSLIFVDLRDRSGIIQLVFDESDTDSEVCGKALSLRNEFVIAAQGTVRAREGAVNEKIGTGAIEVKVSGLRILSESLTPPFQIEDEIQTRDDLRLKYRYLDLRRPELQKNIIFRSAAAKAVRDFLGAEGFIEIETPMLCKSTPEGARDYLVPSRVHPGSFYALPQSPQIYKQLLMCSGFDRYFQLARCFRDEDMRADRQPEFTQIDIEMSFADQNAVMEINERLIAYVWKECLGIEIPLPIPRLTWREAMERYGSDKPDTRFGMELADVTDIAKDCGFGVFKGAVESGGSVRAINAKGQAVMPRKKIDALVEYVKGQGAKGLAYLGINEDGTYKSSFAKFMTEDEISEIIERTGAEAGDLLFFAADSDKVVFASLGALRLHLGEMSGLIDKSKFNFLWVTDFPLLEYSEEEERWVAMHHPFTMPNEEDIALLDTRPELARANAYDIVLNGVELGGGSERIYNPEIQEKMFEAIGFTKEQAEERFGFLLEAFRYGVPPHAGIAYGFDRMIMLMTGVPSIRDCIAFPKVKDASCLMTGAPGIVDSAQLEELSVKIEIPEKEGGARRRQR